MIQVCLVYIIFYFKMIESDFGVVWVLHIAMYVPVFTKRALNPFHFEDKL